MLNEFLLPRGLSQNALARAVGVSPRTVNEIVLGRRAVTAPMSIRLGNYFDQDPGHWLFLQARHDLDQALAGMEGSAISRKATGSSDHGEASEPPPSEEDDLTTWLL